MKNILVSGGAGYIGAHIVDLLCEYNYNVIVFDNLSSGFQENLNPKAKFVNGDIKDKNDLKELFSKNEIDSIIHMAAFKSVGESAGKTSKYTENNIIGSLNLISFAVKYNVEKFIFSSSAAVYGVPQRSLIDENHSLNPINHYGFTKLYIEKYLAWICNLEKLKFVSLRYFNAAGYTFKKDLIKYKEKAPENLLPIVMEVANNSRDKLNIYGNNYDTKDGTCIRDYIHVLDLAEAHIKSIAYLDNNESTEINLSTGIGYSVLDIVNIAKRITRNNINFQFSPRREGDPGILISNYIRGKKLLNWEPKYSINDIISSMWNIYKDD